MLLTKLSCKNTLGNSAPGRPSPAPNHFNAPLTLYPNPPPPPIKTHLKLLYSIYCSSKFQKCAMKIELPIEFVGIFQNEFFKTAQFFLVKNRHSPKERRKVNRDTKQTLERHFALTKYMYQTQLLFLINVPIYATKKGKRTTVSTIQGHVSSSLDDHHPYLKVARRQSVERSPPSVTLAIPSTRNSHSYCFVCKKPEPKLIIAPTDARLRAYYRPPESGRLYDMKVVSFYAFLRTYYV